MSSQNENFYFFKSNYFHFRYFDTLSLTTKIWKIIQNLFLCKKRSFLSECNKESCNKLRVFFWLRKQHNIKKTIASDLFSFLGHSRPHFIFVFSIQLIVHINFVDDCIRTVDLCCQKGPLNYQHHNHCPSLIQFSLSNI